MTDAISRTVRDALVTAQKVCHERFCDVHPLGQAEVCKVTSEALAALPAVEPVPNSALVQLLAAALDHPESAEGYIRQVIETLSRPAPNTARAAAEEIRDWILRHELAASPDVTEEETVTAWASIITSHCFSTAVAQSSCGCIAKIREVARFNTEYGKQCEQNGEQKAAAARYAEAAALFSVADELDLLPTPPTTEGKADESN